MGWLLSEAVKVDGGQGVVGCFDVARLFQWYHVGSGLTWRRENITLSVNNQVIVKC